MSIGNTIMVIGAMCLLCGSTAGAGQTFISQRKNRNENTDDVSLAKQLLAHTLIFTLGNNKLATLRRIAGLESQ